MTYPPYLREKARELRRSEALTIDEIADRLAVSRTTIYFWVGDLPRPMRCVSRAKPPPHHLGNKAMRAKYKRLREEAYQEGVASFESMSREQGFRDFVGLFIAEGYKRNRNVVSVANSDPAVIAVANSWMRRLSRNKLTYWVQYHADQNLPKLRTYWAEQVRVEPSQIQVQRKSNGNQLRGRTWRSEYGVLTVTTHDTYFRSRLQAWVDLLRRLWLDSAAHGA
jgi:AcrR family transcriptional regulator